MPKKTICCECASPLKKEDVALSKKMLGIDIDEFYCLKCLAECLECECDELKIKIQEFKEQGCTLFL